MCYFARNRYTVLPQDLKLAVRLNHKQESTTKQVKYFRSVHKINLRLYWMLNVFHTFEWYDRGEHFFLLPVEIILIGVNIWGFHWCV